MEKYKYMQKIDRVIRNAGKWLVYYKKTPYLINVPDSINNLEKLVNEVFLKEYD